MARSTVFVSNRSRAVRLPKAVAFREGLHQVDVIRLGNSRLITPVGRRWEPVARILRSAFSVQLSRMRYDTSRPPNLRREPVRACSPRPPSSSLARLRARRASLDPLRRAVER